MAGELDKVKKQQLQSAKKPVFMVISDIELMEGVEDKFKQWFLGSNQILSRKEGFITRLLLKSSTPQCKYRIVFITENKESFVRIHRSSEHAKLHAEAKAFMVRPPIRQFHEVIAAG